MHLHLRREWFWDIWQRRVDYRWGLVPKMHVLPGAYELTWGPFQAIVARRVGYLMRAALTLLLLVLALSGCLGQPPRNYTLEAHDLYQYVSESHLGHWKPL